MDTLEQKALGMPSLPSTSGPGNGTTAPADSGPNIADIVKQETDKALRAFQSDFTRKYQDLAETKGQLNATLAQLQAQMASQGQQQPSGNRLSDKLRSQFAQFKDVDPAQLAPLDAMESHLAEMMTPAQQRIAQLEQQLQQQNVSVTQMMNDRRAEQMERDYNKLVDKYGKDAVHSKGEQLGHLVQRGLSLEQAFNAVGQDVIEARVIERIRAEERQRLNEQFGGGLEAMFAAPSAQGTPDYKPGESFEESAINANGLGTIQNHLLQQQLKSLKH